LCEDIQGISRKIIEFIKYIFVCFGSEAFQTVLIDGYYYTSE